MKITILTTYFYPEITAATHLLSDLAYDLAELGAEVTVVTSSPTRGVDENVIEEFSTKNNEVMNSNLLIIRTGKYRKDKNNFIFRAIKYVLNTYSIYRKGREIETDVYLITSTPPFLGVIGTFLSRKAPTVYNLQDIFPDSLICAGKAKDSNLLFPIFRIIERYIYRRNSHIITISKDFKRILLERGVPESKVSMIYNWIDESEVVPINREKNVIFKRYGLDINKFYITYCGNIGYTQNLEIVVDVALELQQKLPELRFVFVGDGAWKRKIEQHIRNRSVKNVTLLPFQPYENISHVMSLGDVSLVCSKSNVGTSSFPSKTWSIMAANRPVICSFDLDSELCEIINQTKSGITVPPDNKGALKDAIIHAYEHREEMNNMGKNGRKFIEDSLNRKIATGKYYEVLEKISKSS